jgi:hypothetical protein
MAPKVPRITGLLKIAGEQAGEKTDTLSLAKHPVLTTRGFVELPWNLLIQ